MKNKTVNWLMKSIIESNKKNRIFFLIWIYCVLETNSSNWTMSRPHTRCSSPLLWFCFGRGFWTAATCFPCCDAASDLTSCLKTERPTVGVEELSAACKSLLSLSDAPIWSTADMQLINGQGWQLSSLWHDLFFFLFLFFLFLCVCRKG